MNAHEKKPRPTLAALQWIDKHTGDAEAAVNDYQQYEHANCLGIRLGQAAWVIEAIAGNLARGTIGRRKTVEQLQALHQMIFELGRDLEPGFSAPSVERERWNLVANGLAPWKPAATYNENVMRYGNEPKKGEGV